MPGVLPPTGSSALGDFARACARLSPGGGVTAALAGLLGFDLRAPARPKPEAAPPAPGPADEPREADRRDPTDALSSSLPSTGSDARLPPTQIGEAAPRIEPILPIPIVAGGWPEPGGEGRASGGERPPGGSGLHPVEVPWGLPPLLDPRRSRAIVRSAASIRHPSGEVDLGRVIATLVRARPLVHLPRRRRWGVHGVDVLVHSSDGMRPFRSDAAALIDAVCRLAGPTAVEIFRFRRSPTELWTPGRRGRRFRVHARRAVLVLSDLGVGRARGFGGREAAQGWSELAERVARGPSALLLNPYGAGGGVVDPGPGLPVVIWDETTTPSLIRAAQRRRSRR